MADLFQRIVSHRSGHPLDGVSLAKQAIIYFRGRRLVELQNLVRHRLQILPRFAHKKGFVFCSIHDYLAFITWSSTFMTLSGVKGFTMKSLAPAAMDSMTSGSC